MRNADRPLNQADLLWLERIANENRQQDRFEDREVQRLIRFKASQALEQKEQLSPSSAMDTANSTSTSPNQSLPQSPLASETALSPTAQQSPPSPQYLYSTKPVPQYSPTAFTQRYSKSIGNNHHRTSEIVANGNHVGLPLIASDPPSPSRLLSHSYASQQAADYRLFRATGSGQYSRGAVDPSDTGLIMGNGGVYPQPKSPQAVYSDQPRVAPAWSNPVYLSGHHTRAFDRAPVN
jgi:hypothetical protein